MGPRGLSTPSSPLGSRTPSPPRLGVGISTALHANKEPLAQYQANVDINRGRSWTAKRDFKTPHHADLIRSKKELLETRKQFGALSKQHDRAEEKLAELRGKLKDARGALAARGRDLDLTQLALERSSGERDELLASAASDKAYMRKLEARLDAMKGAGDVHSRLVRSREEVKALNEKLLSAEARARAAEEIVEAQARENETLRQALQLKAEDMSAGDGEAIHSRLLFAVAKGREEAQSLASQLSESRSRGRAAEAESKALAGEVSQLRADVDGKAQRVLQLEKSLVDAAATCRALEQELQTQRSQQQQAKLDYAQVQLDVNHWREQAHQAEQAAARSCREADVKVQGVREEMQRRLDSAGARASDASDGLRTRMADLEHECSLLRAQTGHLQQQLQAERRAADESASRVQEQAETAAAKLQAAEQREKDLGEEMQNVHSEVDALTELNRRIQEEQEALQQTLTARSQRELELQDHIRGLEEAVAAVKSDGQAREGKLRSRMEALLAELHDALGARDRYRRALDESSSALQAAQQQLAELRQRADSLASGKELLQRTMREQVAAVRAQLDQAQAYNGELERLIQQRLNTPAAAATATAPAGAGSAPGAAATSAAAARPAASPALLSPGMLDSPAPQPAAAWEAEQQALMANRRSWEQRLMAAEERLKSHRNPDQRWSASQPPSPAPQSTACPSPVPSTSAAGAPLASGELHTTISISPSGAAPAPAAAASPSEGTQGSDSQVTRISITSDFNAALFGRSNARDPPGAAATAAASQAPTGHNAALALELKAGGGDANAAAFRSSGGASPTLSELARIDMSIL